MNWQPIETVPKDGTWVLLYAPCDLFPTKDMTHWIAYWKDVGDWNEGWYDQDESVMVVHPDMVTHWMHLPDAPVKPSVGQVHPNDRR